MAEEVLTYTFKDLGLLGPVFHNGVFRKSNGDIYVVTSATPSNEFSVVDGDLVTTVSLSGNRQINNNGTEAWGPVEWEFRVPLAKGVWVVLGLDGDNGEDGAWDVLPTLLIQDVSATDAEDLDKSVSSERYAQALDVLNRITEE